MRRQVTVYTVRPVFTVTEHRVQVIEQAKPPKRELGPPTPLENFIGWVIGVPLALWFFSWLGSALCGCH